MKIPKRIIKATICKPKIPFWEGIFVFGASAYNFWSKI
jgi:hypothetical protein